jgi:hypothetical protein
MRAVLVFEFPLDSERIVAPEERMKFSLVENWRRR